MTTRARADDVARRVFVGHLSREVLLARLHASGTLLNEHANTLLDDSAFDDVGEGEVISIAERSVAAIGLADGATLTQIYARATCQGLLLCPAVAGPYLRFALAQQQSAPDSVLSSGRAPTGSVTVAARALREDDEFPKGFYLRTIDGKPWLRGFRCDDQHLWSPADRFIFRTPE
ncbi:hypothetical protein [Microbacterium sp. NPDC076911]|uniref:hypothetical protein n=1 Tax=Microbacterium sp. NPDC076911 TaxID=3154958 RepID=UPI00342E8CC1